MKMWILAIIDRLRGIWRTPPQLARMVNHKPYEFKTANPPFGSDIHPRQ